MYQQAPKLLAEKAGTLTEAFKELATQTPAEKNLPTNPNFK